MRLDRPTSRGPARLPLGRRLELSQRALLVLLVFALGLGMVIQRTGVLGDLRRFLSHDLGTVAWNKVTSLSVEPERLILDVKYEHWEKLSRWQQQADRQWQITPDLKEYVPAQATVGADTARVRIRLKGEWGDHVDTDKWSLRVKVRGGQTLFGMERFSIQHPKTRGYAMEWLYHRALAREGVMALRYRFIAVTINGRDLGVYALEEHFTKELTEHNQRRESVIVKLNADYKYKPVGSRQGSMFYAPRTGMVSQFSAEVVAYDDDRFAEDPAMAARFDAARELLEGLRAGELAASEVFDVERTAAYLAVSELLGTRETAGDWSDMRFYFDPLTTRLEPVGVEGALYLAYDDLLGPTSRTAGTPDDFHTRLFADDTFFRAYVAALERVSAPEWIDALLADVGADLDAALAVLHKEWPEQELSRRVIDANAQTIRDFLDPEKGVAAWVEASGPGALVLELGALQAMPIEVLRVTGDGFVREPEAPLLLEGKPAGRPVLWRSATVRTDDPAAPAPSAEALATGTVHYRLLGSTSERTTALFPGPRRAAELALNRAAVLLRPNPEAFAFLEIDAEARTITFRSGEHTLEEPLVLPADYTIHAAGGVTLDLRAGAGIVSYSPLDWRGRLADPGAGPGPEDAPIVVRSSDGTGAGLAVLDAGEGSQLEGVVFEGLAAPRAAGWEPTGAVTFYRSPVALVGCRFAGNASEDSLNLVSSPYVIEGCAFVDAPSDALDGDWSDGRIERTRFARIGGDAIDVSGSRVELRDVRIEAAADKGLSVGEASTLEGTDVAIRGAGIGVASKDLSSVRIEGLAIEDATVGLTAYVKKPEYGPGRLAVERLTLTRVETPYLLEPGSEIEVDGEAKPVNAEALEQRFYAEEQAPAQDAEPAGDAAGTRRP